MIYTLTLNPAVDREYTVPEIEFNSVMRASGSQADFGGKGFNVSRLLKCLDTYSTAVGFLGGKAGEFLQEGLQSLGIGAEFVWVNDETRTNISIVTSQGGYHIKVNERGPIIEPGKQQELLEKIEALARPGDWWVLSGSLPPGVPDDFYKRVIQILTPHNAQAVVDTSGEPLRLSCQEKPFLVKPNIEEAHVLTGMSVGSSQEIAKTAEEIRKTGALNVIISMGKAGALLQTNEGTWLAHSPAIMEKNPIGAGDSVVGGFVWALTNDLSMIDAFRFGIACGAATASLSGTMVGTRALVEELLTHIQIDPIPADTHNGASCYN